MMNKEFFLIRAATGLKDIILRLNGKVESVRGRWLEIAVFFLYGILHLVMAIFHEPWYDEAVAWQIARCVSVKNILLEVPHYEGHPPLWHLILVPFAKLGAPYELSLTLVSLVFTLLVVWLILFRSPFPRLLRLLLPFTYFVFYQYGVISRPYCMMMLAFLLLACLYKNRNRKPWLYVLCLAFLCLTSAYCILIAGMMAFLWLIEIVRTPYMEQEKDKKTNLRVKISGICRDSRIWCLLALLVFACVLALDILPSSDALAVNIFRMFTAKQNSIWLCLFYTWFVMPADAIYTNTYGSDQFLKYYSFQVSDMILPVVITGILFWLIFNWGRKKGTFWQYMLPHLVYGLFFASVYGTVHHTGIETILILYWFWITLDADTQAPEGKMNLSKEKADRNEKYLELETVLLVAASMGMLLYWSVSVCMLDIKKEYSYGREVAGFIKEKHLDQYKIMIPWRVVSEKEEDGEKKRVYIDTNDQGTIDQIAPYFDRNIIYNAGDGEDSAAYSSHHMTSEEENEENRRRWAAQGAPDVLIGTADLEWVFGDSVSIRDYVPVYYHPLYQAWKNGKKIYYVVIYVREDLFEILDLERVEEVEILMHMDEINNSEP